MDTQHALNLQTISSAVDIQPKINLKGVFKKTRVIAVSTKSRLDKDLRKEEHAVEKVKLKDRRCSSSLGDRGTLIHGVLAGDI
jgi:hypothetical protein